MKIHQHPGYYSAGDWAPHVKIERGPRNVSKTSNHRKFFRKYIRGNLLRNGTLSTTVPPSYREYRNNFSSWPKESERLSSYSALLDAYCDYYDLISRYYLAQGFLNAAGDLLGQIVTTVDLKQIPGHANKEQKLIRVCQSFIKELPPEACEEVNKQFVRRKRAIEDSQEYYYLAGFEIIVTLLKRSGYTVSDEPLEKLYKTIWSHNHIRLLIEGGWAGEERKWIRLNED